MRHFNTIAIWAALIVCPTTCQSSWASEIKSDEQVVFFPTAAWQSEDGNSWIVSIHGWIFEPEEDDLLRAAAVETLQHCLPWLAVDGSRSVFSQRVRLFLRDNERGKRIKVRLGQQEFSLGPSSKDGHFDGTICIARETAEALAADGKLQFQAVTRPQDKRTFTGIAFLVPPTGVSIISDIDDTIGVTETHDTQKLLANTLARPYRAVPKMAQVYSQWAAAGAHIHFVSASPCQLYEPLSQFAEKSGFPVASYYLQRVRLKDSGFAGLAQLCAEPLQTKLSAIESIFARYPGRKFVLVGDSAQQDAEIYGIVARRHPQQILRIYIRDVGGEAIDCQKYPEAFRAVDAAKWRVFQDPAELEKLAAATRASRSECRRARRELPARCCPL